MSPIGVAIVNQPEKLIRAYIWRDKNGRCLSLSPPEWGTYPEDMLVEWGDGPPFVLTSDGGNVCSDWPEVFGLEDLDLGEVATVHFRVRVIKRERLGPPWEDDEDLREVNET